MAIRTSVRALQQLIRPSTPDLDQTGYLIGLTRRMREAIDARNAARRAANQPAYTMEREDPNLGTMSLVAQALDEQGSRVRRPRSLMQIRG